MNIKHVLLLSATIFFFACGNTKKVADEMTGEYYGILPCADCPGIYYELQLHEDFTYSEKRFYLDSEADTFTVRGSFRIMADSIIVLGEKKGGLDHLKFSNGKLEVLDKEGNEITTELAEFYILKTTKPENHLQAEEASYLKKSNFKATGTEPFWAVQINVRENHMKFEPMDGETITTSLPTGVQTEKGLLYEAVSDLGMLKVLLLEETCQNDMSGELFSHKVSVTFKYPEMEKTKTYTGCGEYARIGEAPAELEGIWVLKEIDHEMVKNDMSSENPTLEIQPSSGKLVGNGGCNQYSGTIKTIGENEISISKIRSTKMACPNLTMENEYFDALTSGPLNYKIAEGKLILFNREHILILEKKH